jgi:uncharacterized membrane protein YfcA
MSNAKTGLAAAVGAIFGGAVGAAAGRYAALNRPRLRYTTGESRRKGRGQAVEDAMVIGGGVGATVGAFLGGTIAGNDPPKQLR